MKQQINPVGIGLAVAGATAAIVSMFLPLAEPVGIGGISGNSLVQGDSGLGVAARQTILAIVVLSLTYRYYNARRPGWGVIVAGALLAVGAGVDLSNDSLFTLTRDYLDGSDFSIDSEETVADPGIALYVAGVGGVLAAVGGYLMWTSAPAAGNATETAA
jgi:hypothetical protein